VGVRFLAWMRAPPSRGGGDYRLTRERMRIRPEPGAGTSVIFTRGAAVA
jgi:hypothetical protein